MVWQSYRLQFRLNRPAINASEEDKVNADLQGITLKQYKFNQWKEEIEKSGYNSFRLLEKPVKLSWWKCWFWWAIPGFFLGVDDRMKFCGWKIGHCLNCDADPYDGTVEAWSYDNNWFRGALIRCNRCGQLRWQPGDSGRDY